MKKSIILLAFLCLGFVVLGCDSETQPDQRLIDSANAQREAQQPGQPQTPPTEPGK